MVCDLQGIFNTDMVPPTFELTDPAIHYASTKGRRVVFGRTDKGKSGMNVFFKTHKCNKLCKYMQLSAKNKKWQRSWRRESAQGHNFAAGFSKWSTNYPEKASQLKLPWAGALLSGKHHSRDGMESLCPIMLAFSKRHSC